jgi:hypothetical protein
LEEGKDRRGVGIVEDEAGDARKKALISDEGCLMENEIEVGTLKREMRMLITT